MDFAQLFAAALGGGVTVKLLEIGYQELRRHKSDKQLVEGFVDDHLDPLLKSADELVGKLRSLAEEDFRPVIDVNLNDEALRNHDFASLVFLFGRFWAQIEYIRRQGMSVAMARDPRGAKLQNFFDCLESRRVRMIDRILQRAIGEMFLDNSTAILFVEFIAKYEASPAMRQWMSPLMHFLSRTKHTAVRQRLLQYGVIIHSLIDTLDDKHLVTRNRPAWPKKLSRRSWTDLNYRVFGVYLKFVTNRQKYLGPPKKAAQKRGGNA